LPGNPPVRDAIAAYMAPQHPVPVRLTALGYYFENGVRDQLPLVERHAKDDARAPECVKDAEGCEWQCEISTGGEQVVKPVQSVGDFVEYCVKPAMQQRSSLAAVQATATPR
jgi:hypothetical protein